MRSRLTIIAFILALFVLSTPLSSFAEVNKSEDIDPENISSWQDIVSLLEQKRFAELDKIARYYKDNKSYTTGGIPKLDFFYESFNCNVSSCSENDIEPAYKWTLDLMNSWNNEYPNSVTARVAEASVWIDYAWFSRGSGLAYTVTDEGWRLFHERIDRAYDLLKQAPKDKADDCPERYAKLLIVGMAQNWSKKRYNAVFDEAIAFDPVYYTYYKQKTIYLLPRWHGRPGDWQRFADEAVTLTPKSEGMIAYMIVVSAAQSYGKGEWNYFQGSGVSWPKMKQGYLDMEKKFPDSKWNLNRFAMFAARANDYETASRLFERIGNNPVEKVWMGRKNYYSYRHYVQSGKSFPVPLKFVLKEYMRKTSLIIKAFYTLFSSLF